MTVQAFADILKVPVDRLIQALDQAGINHASPTMIIAEPERSEFLAYLRRSHRESTGESRPVKVKETREEKLSRIAWNRATRDRHDAIRQSAAARTYDPAENDGHFNADSDSDRESK